MTAARFRPVTTVLLAIASAVVLVVAPAGVSAFVLATEFRLLADEGWIMGGTGNPGPDPVYQGEVTNLYLQPSSPLFDGQLTFPGYNFQGLTTPEQFCPITACPPGGLNFGDSLNVGAADLNNAIVPQLTGGDNVTVFGYSQSGTVSTLEMNNLLANAGKAGFPTADQLQNLHSVIIGDPNNPVSGILDRYQFPEGIGPNFAPQPQHVPFVNIPLGIAPTPTSGIGDSAVYTGEYDGWANMPQDQTNILAMINALIGIETVHGYYPSYTPAQLADTIDIGKVGDTNFYMIPENLPILQFMFNGGTAGQFFGDFFSPWARLFIDWGYGNAGDPAVDGLFKIPSAPGVDGANISGSPFQAAFGVAGGPWAATPYGDLYQSTLDPSDVASSGVAGLFEKMDPLQMLAGLDNAFIQSIIGPWVDVAAAAGPLSPGDISTIDGVISSLQAVTGYDLINELDQLMLGGLKDAGLQGVVNTLFDGPVIPGQGLIALVGGAFDMFNLFGA